MKAVRWSERALVELERIFEFIAQDDVDAAERWVAGLQGAAGRLARFPRAGRVVPELERQDVREIVKGNYRLVYLLTANGPVIVTVFEAHHRFPGDFDPD